jgi:hypothetical protein
MSIDSSKQGRPNAMEIVLLVGNMVRGTRVAKLLGETKVNDVYKMGRFPCAHDEVGRLDVAMDERVRVDILNTRYLVEMKLVKGADRRRKRPWRWDSPVDLRAARQS